MKLVQGFQVRCEIVTYQAPSLLEFLWIKIKFIRLYLFHVLRIVMDLNRSNRFGSNRNRMMDIPDAVQYWVIIYRTEGHCLVQYSTGKHALRRLQMWRGSFHLTTKGFMYLLFTKPNSTVPLPDVSKYCTVRVLYNH